MPFVVKDENYPAIHAEITNRNMLWQFDFMIDSAKLAIDVIGSSDAWMTYDFVMALHHFAVINLSPRPGQTRTDFVHITNSDHEPPSADHVLNHMLDFVIEQRRRWSTDSAIELASYVLWRLTWIHPFEDGNGRTARAACYYCLCAKLGAILPGRRTIPDLIRSDPDPYYAALRHADRTHKSGNVDLAPLTILIDKLLRSQLQSALS